MNLYQHFRAEEREFIDQAVDWKNYVENAYAPKLTDFLDPRQQHILSTIIGQNNNVRVSFFGGMENSERKRGLLYPDYFQEQESDFHIRLFEVHYPRNFVTIEHRQVLGSLMALGLKRGKFGDILYDGTSVQFFATEEIADYLRMELQSIGKTKVRIEEIPFDQAITIKESWQEISITCSSLRLDAVVAAIYHISRQKAQTLIGQGLLKVNWAAIDMPSFECQEGDTISARGFGRAKIKAIDGKTKKDKWRIIANQLK